MKRALVIIIGLLIIIALAWALTRESKDGSKGIQGVISSIDTEQAMFDGPYVVIMETDAGLQEVIHIPSMGINLCEARNSIANTSELSNGMRIEVAGTRAEGGIIVPCESTSHYLKVI